MGIVAGMARLGLYMAGPAYHDPLHAVSGLYSMLSQYKLVLKKVYLLLVNGRNWGYRSPILIPQTPVWGSQNLGGTILGVRIIKLCSILWSILGHLYLGSYHFNPGDPKRPGASDGIKTSSELGSRTCTGVRMNRSRYIGEVVGAWT